MGSRGEVIMEVLGSREEVIMEEVGSREVILTSRSQLDTRLQNTPDYKIH